MSHFYTSVNNSRGRKVTAAGTKQRGQSCHIRGWDAGVMVTARVDGDDIDCFDIYLTAGSNGNEPEELLMTYTRAKKSTAKK